MAVLTKAGIQPLPQQQVRVAVRRKKYKIDYGWRDAKEGFEYMGFDGHGNLVTQFHDDAERVWFLQESGWKLWPITAETPRDRIVETAFRITAQLSGATPSR